MKLPATDPDGLQSHMLGTYHSMRLGVAWLGIVLVLALYFIGPRVDSDVWKGVLRGSMSAYYHHRWMRDLFVGILVAIAALIYLYKGFSTAENVALNLAGILALGVAWFPTAKHGEERDILGYAHVACAIGFFLCIGYVSVARADDTLSLMHNADTAEKYRKAYRLLGAGMIASPILALIMSTVLDSGGNNRSLVFYIEAAGVLMFAAYWLVKSREMRETGADAYAGEALLKKAVDSDKPGFRRTAPGNLVVAQHGTAYQEMLDDLAAKGRKP